MKAYERLLKYVTVLTPSDENSSTVPSSDCQFHLGKLLVEELKELGVTDAHIDDQCYVYGHLPATKGFESCTSVGFISHMDTVSDFCDHAITPVITKDYDGKALTLGTSGRVLDPKMFPHLASLKGRTLITSDGTTILGSDDKAGIAEIMTALESIIKNQIPHGPVSIAFTPDEEIGMGPAHFNVKEFGAKYAYTVDGEAEGEIQFENFNASKATFEVSGVNVHPGSAKDTMVNASLVAMEIQSMLPAGNTPRDTQGYEGFFHLYDIHGDVASATLHYIIRDHDAVSFKKREDLLYKITEELNKKWGEGTVRLTITEQYKNMSEIIATCPFLIDLAKEACKKASVEPLILPIRGGTDGAQLSFMGLPCPNLGTGGYCFHGPYEHITVEAMDLCTKIITELIQAFSRK